MSRARILGDRDVLVQVGSDINLTCRAEESPDVPDGVVWYKNDIRVDNLLVRGGISVVTEVIIGQLDHPFLLKKHFFFISFLKKNIFSFS